MSEIDDVLRAGRVPPLQLTDGTVLGDEPSEAAVLAGQLRRVDGGRASNARYMAMAQRVLDLKAGETS